MILLNAAEVWLGSIEKSGAARHPGYMVRGLKTNTVDGDVPTQFSTATV
jgi:hypothetical protein